MLLLASCGDDPVAPLSRCTGPISVVSGTGQDARFDWTPRCGLFAINLVPPPGGAGSPTEGWTVISETVLIAPGIRHGEAPSGTRLEVPAFQVTAGTGYQVNFTAQPGQPPITTVLWTP